MTAAPRRAVVGPAPRASVAALAFLACGAAGCGGEPEPAREWASMRVLGLPSPSGVAVVGDTLLFTSSETSRLYAVPRAAVRDGGEATAAASDLGVARDREVGLRDGDDRDLAPGAGRERRQARFFRLGDLWVGPQRLSGLSVSEDRVLYATSEAYRLVWFGPLEPPQTPGAAPRCTFQRAFEVDGARRTRRAESDWQDYGDPQAANGIAGCSVDGEDLLVVERGRGSTTPMAYRLDRVAGTGVRKVGLKYAGTDDDPDTRGWTDLAAVPGGFLASIARVEGGVSSTRVLAVPFSRQDREGLSATGYLALPDGPPSEPCEGFTKAGAEVYAVRADGPGAAALLWRRAP